MTSTPDSKDTDIHKDNDDDENYSTDTIKDEDTGRGSSSSPPSLSKSSPPPSSSSSQPPPPPHSSTPPPPSTSPPPPPSAPEESSPSPPKAPPHSAPPAPNTSPPPPSYESKEIEAPPAQTTPDYSPPAKQDSISPNPPSRKSSPQQDSSKSEDSSSPSTPLPPPSQSQPQSATENENQNQNQKQKQATFSPPSNENSSSSSSSTLPSDSNPSPPSSSPQSSWNLPDATMISKSPSEGSLNSMDYTFSRSNPSPNRATQLGIAFGVVAGVLVIGIIIATLFLHRRRRKGKRYNDTMYMMHPVFGSSPDFGNSSSITRPSPHSGGDHTFSSAEIGGIGHSKTWFAYEELAEATDGFDSKNIIGSGGFGCVYKGYLQDGTSVAIKKLKDKSGQGDREFRAEVEIISRVHHRHLVSLVGYCLHDEQRLLVYDFVPNNTLHYHLHSQSKAAMEWGLRVRVACGSSRGIAYLHEDCHPRIIHRDIKSANILLANNFEAKVADFGLAKLAQELESHTHVSTRVMGTFGYMAPEYATSGKLTEKSDVFSFGVVLLEIITGRKPVDDTRPIGDESLVEWARPLMSEALESQKVDELADSRLEGNYDRGEMFRMIEAAAACVRNSASKRPRMSQVVRALDTMGDLSNGMRPGESEIIDSREQSAQIRMFKRMTFESQDYSSFNRQNSESSSGEIGSWRGQT